MSTEDDLRRIQKETWPDMNTLEQKMMGSHRTVRLEIPLHASGAMHEASRMLRGLADRLDEVYALKGPQMTERLLIISMQDYAEFTQKQLNGLCPWRREYKRKLNRMTQDVSDRPAVLSQHKG